MWNEGNTLEKVLLAEPRPERARVFSLRRHNFGGWINHEAIRRQFHTLKETLEQHGTEVAVIPQMPGYPNSIFLRDTASMTHEGFIALRMGLATRRGEDEAVAAYLRREGFAELGSIEPPGTVEGGDIILAGTTAFVGHSRRTNREGALQVQELLESIGFSVRVVPVPPPHLHLGGFMSMVDPETILHREIPIDREVFAGYQTISVPDPSFISANVICMAPRLVLADASQATTIETLEQHGVQALVIDASEYVRANGGLNCLILPLVRAG
ncbi:MAG: hypothetical protein GXO82_04430 [Chlorobi bacterium]|nr:hypothetical protein [Chlorobiota bacterium]